jgi:hypothetical protein
LELAERGERAMATKPCGPIVGPEAGGPPCGAPKGPRSFAAWSVCAGTRGQVEQLPEIQVRAGQRTAVSVWATGESEQGVSPPGKEPRARGPAERKDAREPAFVGALDRALSAGIAPAAPGFTGYRIDAVRPGVYWAAWSVTLWGDVAPLLRAGICGGPEAPLCLARALPAGRGEKGERLGAHYAGGDSGPIVLRAGQELRLAIDPVEFDSSTRVAAWRIALHSLD